MPSEFAFRLCTFLTLGLACAGLGYAEREYLPEVSALAVVVIASLVVLFRAGARYELSLKAANRVGLAIAAVTAGWLAYLFGNRNSLIYTFPWPASLLPCLGPLLLVLIPAKLSRPKHVGDWWVMQGMGLVAVGLASAMAEDEVVGVILVLYAVSAVSTLTLFYFRRSAGMIPPAPKWTPGSVLPPRFVVNLFRELRDWLPTRIGRVLGLPALTPAEPEPMPEPDPVLIADGVSSAARSPSRTLVFRAVGWLAAAVLVSLPAFFLTPRSDAPRWQFSRSNLETGYGSDQMIDLNRTGDLRVNREVAYEVTAAYPDGRPKEDLNPNQRWRGSGFHIYEGGRWGRTTLGRLVAQQVTPPPALNEVDKLAPPDFGPGQYSLTFRPKVRLAEPVLADPVAWEPGRSSPVWTLTSPDPRPWRQLPDGTFQTVRRTEDLPPYRQFVRAKTDPVDDPDLGAPFELGYPLRLPDQEPGHLLHYYTEVRLPRVRVFAVELLEKLGEKDEALKAARGRLDARVSYQLAAQDFEPVARAFSRHLAESGEYTYTTALRRTDRNVDPVEEFLLRTKTGHCERYAAGLALLLRSLGVPAVYVLGYKGCEHDGNGVYLIRQEFAHAWVEVMVPRPAPPGFRFAETPPGVPPKTEVWHWLSLDPTPAGGGSENATTVGAWLDDARATWSTFFMDFIVGYNPQRRQAAVDAVTDWLERWWWAVFALPMTVAVFFAARFTVRRWGHAVGIGANGTGTGFPWYDDLTRALRDHDPAPPPGATPREAAEAAATALAAGPRTAAVAEVPRDVTRAYYLARYAGRPPTADELAALTAAVDRLRAALRGRS